MLVCHCQVVNDRRIRAEIERGARDEVDIALACGAGTQCGGCLPAVNRLLDECVQCPRRPAAVFVDPAAPVAVG
ncbi:MAG: (2Fe-2S)-binding protein [Nitriliruptorales bacterium]|nr:(2Fe-2S)-binding protein [Nitriliruptorales bacterium]